MKLLLLANPAAGPQARRWLPPLREFISRRSSQLEYCEAPSVAELRQRAQEATREGYDAVLAAGGDGTVHAVLNALCGTDTVLGILPLGHGNDLARALALPLDPFAAADCVLRGSVASMDVARVGDEVYGAVAGVGFDSEVNRRANSWGSWPSGHARYFLAALRTLASYRPIPIELVSDADNYSGEVMWVAVANAQTYGGGMPIAPRAAVDDGVLDVCLVEPISRPALLFELYPLLLRGEHLQAAGVRYFQATRIELRAPAGAELFGDGEFLARLPLAIAVEPAAVRVLRRRD